MNFQKLMDNPDILKKKKVEKEIKESEKDRQLREFKEKYPKYIHNEKVLYPIEDSLFTEYPLVLGDRDLSRPKVQFLLNF